MTSDPRPRHSARHSARLPLTPLYGPSFTAAPEQTYDHLRASFGDSAPVELAPGVRATLTLSYRAALEVLRHPHAFRRDPRPWQYTVPQTSSVLGTMSYRPNAMFSDGAEHRRLRSAITEALKAVDQEVLSREITTVADGLIGHIAHRGSADLVNEYALPLLMIVFTRMFGSSDALAQRVMLGVQRLFDGDDPEGAARALDSVLAELLDYKRRTPGDDVVTRLLASHGQLSEEELRQTVLLLMGTGSEPVANLLTAALVELLTNPALSEGLTGGTVAIRSAIHEILWRRPPVSNYGISYPVRPYLLFGRMLPAGEPVVISFAAANADPAATNRDFTHVGNRAHLAFSAGPHQCPVPQMGLLFATTAIQRVLEQLPGLTLSCPVERLPWRASPFSRGLSELPVAFPPRRDVSQPAASSTPADVNGSHRQRAVPPGRSRLPAALWSWWRGHFHSKGD
ncbi:cytochrome P450 [Allokutzneria sp. A3M-2-11 16]|uniref:cytochrome P450 n=1 Tax=Allokutzneria sp. A3M-2-11 16 TaxID=2962043 RepID=UPI0020B76500|nr:cytochrome P450 [Allokutzneria sp. A3M-2-11 16]MCP3803386.1 cytochrome P450 [Allokutzneria sp. A3M-2-11 16]